PDAHGIFALAKNDHISDAWNPLQRVLDIDVEIIGNVLVREAVIRGEEAGGKNKVGICLGDGYAGVFDFLRQPSLRTGHAVLHIDGCDVQVVSSAESYIDAACAVVRAGRGNVVHALNAIDLLLNRSGDRNSNN